MSSHMVWYTMGLGCTLNYGELLPTFFHIFRVFNVWSTLGLEELISVLPSQQALELL